MRDSVKRILSTANGFKQKDVPFHEDIVTEILKHYQLHHNENSIPNLGVEIFPVKETVVSSSGTSSTEVKVGVTGYFNNQPLHTPAIALALIDNILMDYVEDKIRRDAIIHKQPKYEPKGYYFQVGNHPLNYQPADLLKYYELFIDQLNAFSWVAYGVGRNALTMILVAACCVAHKIFSNSKKKRMMEKKAIEKKARKWRPVIVNEHEVRDYDVLAETAKIYRGDDSRDFTISELSGLEVLELIGSLRKIPPDTLDSLTEYYTANLGFKNEIELPISGYSHVHAKKLSVAAALLGKFEVLLLDEPLDHLDPKSRQFIISSVKRLMQDGCMVVWTAHSIEQCENICTKMSILVNGSLRCIGSLTHLRGLYEEGYTVIVRFLLDRDMIYFTSKKNIRMEHELRENDVEDDLGINVGQVKQEQRKKTLTEALGDAELALSELAPWEQDLCPFVAYFERAFPDSILVDKQPGFIHYHVNKNQAAWSVLFRKMEEAKAVAEVDSYYIACTNLDQVFFNFTRGQISFEG
ncbi:unnamed protein product [Orchesella dallaii]|uniref:ABCA1-4-like C-terminal R2 regulatory domain-containing protein n=1 Tax=Orchesella dallaii TaxID=48710 RepID=A0ABP1RE36_9HEXA